MWEATHHSQVSPTRRKDKLVNWARPKGAPAGLRFNGLSNISKCHLAVGFRTAFPLTENTVKPSPAQRQCLSFVYNLIKSDHVLET